MKYILVLCVCAVIVAAEWKPRTMEEFFKYREECFKEEKVPAAAIENIKTKKFSEEPEALCYVRCMGKKSGMWDDTKGYDIERVYETFHAANWDVSKENLKKCFTPVKDPNPCVWAATNMRCLWTNNYATKKN